MADTKTFLDYIFKKNEKCMYYEVNPFCVRGQEKDFPFIMNGILKMAWFVHIFLQNQHMISIVYALN